MSGLSVPSAQAEKSSHRVSLPDEIWLTLHFLSGRAILAHAFLTYEEADDHRLTCELELFGKAANEPFENHDCHVSVMCAPLGAKEAAK